MALVAKRLISKPTPLIKRTTPGPNAKSKDQARAYRRDAQHITLFFICRSVGDLLAVIFSASLYSYHTLYNLNGINQVQTFEHTRIILIVVVGVWRHVGISARWSSFCWKWKIARARVSARKIACKKIA